MRVDASGHPVLETLGYRVNEWEQGALRPIPESEVDSEVRIDTSMAHNVKRSRMFSSLDAEFIVPEHAPMHPDAGDVQTTVEGAKKRFARTLPKAQDGLLARLALFTSRFCETFFKPLDDIMPFDCRTEGVVAEPCGRCYCCQSPLSQARLDEYRAAFAKLHGAKPSRRLRRKIKSFTKSETYAPEVKYARWINSRSDAFKVYSGPFFKEVEKVVFSNPHFVKHVPVAERPALLEAFFQTSRKYFITDYTAFESHMIKQLMESTELILYRYMGQKYPDLVETICKTISGENRCRHRTGVRVTCQARRMSGDMCTSLGNGFTNLMIALFVLWTEGQWNFDDKGADVLVEGDDGMIAVDKSSKLDVSDFTKLGMTIKLFRAVSPGLGLQFPEHATRDNGSPQAGVAFCGLNVVDGHCLRDVRPFMAKFAWALNESGASPLRRAQLLVAKAMSTLAETPACPIISVIAQRVLTKYQGIEPIFKEDGYHMAVTKTVSAKPPTNAVREAFARLTGVTPAQQVVAEERILAGETSQVMSEILSPTPAQTRYWSGWVEVG